MLMSAPGGLELAHHLTGGIGLQAFVGQRRARDVTAQLLQCLAVFGAAAHRRQALAASRIRSVARATSATWRPRHSAASGQEPSVTDLGSGHSDRVESTTDPVGATRAQQQGEPIDRRE